MASDNEINYESGPLVHESFPAPQSAAVGKGYSNPASKPLRNFDKDPWNYPFDPGR